MAALPSARRWVCLLKGLVPVLAALFFGFGPWGAVAAGASAVVLSRIVPFRRRRGATVAFGALIGLSPLAVFWAAAVAALVFAASRRPPLAVACAAILVPPLMWQFGSPLPYVCFALAAGAFIVLRHRGSLALRRRVTLQQG